MNDPKKFEAQGSGDYSAVEVPSWIRSMNEHYHRTGTVRSEDAARFVGTTHPGGQMSSAFVEGKDKNTDG
jgi:hypothetical protein